MDWKELGGKLIAIGAPALGGALLGPGGAVAGQVLASALGTDATPEAVAQKIDAAPAAAEAKIVQADSMWSAMIAESQAMAEVGKAEVEQVNETMRAEIAGGDGLLGRWRGLMAWELLFEAPFWGLGMLYCIVFRPESFNTMVNGSALILAWWAARWGVLGVHVWQGSQERQVAITGVPASVGKAVATVVKQATKGKA